MGRFQEGPDGLGKSPHIQHMRPHHRSMARAVALGQREPKDLAVVYSMTSGQISRIMGSPCFQAEVARLEEELEIVTFDMAKDLQMMGQKAVENLDEDLHIDPTNPENRKLRNTTSLEIMGMLGLRNKGATGNTYIEKMLNVTQHNYDKEVEEMSPQELRQDVMELIKGDSGLYE